jgi:hypothetical protein
MPVDAGAVSESTPTGVRVLVVVASRRWNDDESVETSVTNSGPLIGPASSCGCPAACDAFGGSAARRRLR